MGNKWKESFERLEGWKLEVGSPKSGEDRRPETEDRRRAVVSC